MKHLFTAALIAVISSIYAANAKADDVQVFDRAAEDIVREGEILVMDAEINGSVVTRHYVVEHNRRLYACLQQSDFRFVDWYCILDEE